MQSSPYRSALPTHVIATVGARLTLPASTAEESVRGSGRQVRILRAPSLAALEEIVTRELRAFAMSFIGESKGTRKRGGGADRAITNAAIATSVLSALDAGDFRAAVVAHATGFGLGVELPPQLGGEIGDCFRLPAPGARKSRAVVPNDADFDAPETDAAEDEIELDAPADAVVVATDPSVRQAA